MFQRTCDPRRLFAATLLALAPFAAEHVQAQMPPIMAAGDPIVTGFSGTAQPLPPFPSGNPIDETFINLDGPSMQIQRLQPAGPPAGQFISSPSLFTARARDVGQTFAITIDDWLSPNIFLGATSAFGLQIVEPDNDGDGRPERITAGKPGAQWMAGQWGPGGTAGSIWRVDGTTGAITLFTTIGANAGPGLGDIVYDRGSRQFFVSDLDTGLIYRLDWTGFIVDTFDHGSIARPAMGLPPVADDNTFMDIQNPAFDALNPATWGYTQPERRVRGLAVFAGRLFYAVAGPQIWSVGIRLDGTFANDARWELDVVSSASANEVSDIVFDGQGRMILAQRGEQRGSYDYSVFADPMLSAVMRYQREIPDNPATPGTWVPVPQEYAIGFRPNGNNTTGGIALGYGYNTLGQLRSGACNEYLWTTGESLRDNAAFAAILATGGPATVHGLQGNSAKLVRPQNDPPFQSYFADYDGQFVDPQNQGHIGDVEIWQPCAGGSYTYYPPYYPPPGYTPPPGTTYNLSLDKAAVPYTCAPGGLGFLCTYTVRVTNTGSSWYWGAITVQDWLPANPAGAGVSFAPEPPWWCAGIGPATYQCSYPPVFLWPGESVDLQVTVELPGDTDLCSVANAARLYWWGGLGDANPGDDWDFASSLVPGVHCPPPQGEETNLKIEKTGWEVCEDQGDNWWCVFVVTVTNTGPGAYTGDVVVTDTLSVSDPILYMPNPPWTCVSAGPVHTCTFPGASLPDGGQLNNGSAIQLGIGVEVPKQAQVDAGKCWVDNEATITAAPGGSPLNTNPADDTAAFSSKTPGENCEPLGGETDLSISKVGGGCTYVGDGPVAMIIIDKPLEIIGDDQPPPPTHDGGAWDCTFGITITNEGPNDFSGPITLKDVVTPPGSAVWFDSPACGPTGVPGEYECSTPGHFIPFPGATPLTMHVIVPDDGSVCEINNHVELAVPPGGSPSNTDPTNDSADASLPVPSQFCDDELLEEQIIEGPVCPIEQRTPDGGCCPDGERWTGRACSGGGQPPPPPPPPPPLTCPEGTTGTPPNCTPIVQQCPQGFVGTPPNCRPPSTQTCPAGTTGTPPNCIPSACPPGFAGKPPNCFPAQCPAGTMGTPPNCVPIQCPPGTVGTPPNCQQVQQQCPAGSVGQYPNCRCPPGTQGTPPNCVQTPQQCPPGTTGIPPLCVEVQQQCPAGSVGKWPNCQCPRGTTGTPPNCVPNQTGPTGPAGGPNIQGGNNPPVLQLNPNIILQPQQVPRQGQQQPQKPTQGGQQGSGPPQCPPGTIGLFPLCIPQ